MTKFWILFIIFFASIQSFLFFLTLINTRGVKTFFSTILLSPSHRSWRTRPIKKLPTNAAALYAMHELSVEKIYKELNAEKFRCFHVQK